MVDRLVKNLELTFTLTNGEVEVIVYEPESGEFARINTPYSPDEHPEFDERLCREIYSWLSMWMDEMEDNNEE